MAMERREQERGFTPQQTSREIEETGRRFEDIFGSTSKKEENTPTKITISALFASDDGIVHAKARRQLVDHRSRAVASLVKTLSDEYHWVRWEAAKALSQIGSQKSIHALAEALSDKEFDVHWLAAEGLIRIGRKSIVPMLTVLVEYPRFTLAT
jgi:HEAT repeat protein